jgi:hypothetical protein
MTGRRLPRCELCRAEPATTFSWFAGTWRFAGRCTSDREQYFIEMHQGGHGFLDSAASREHWLDHLREKRWFNEADFLAMLRRHEAAASRTRHAKEEAS